MTRVAALLLCAVTSAGLAGDSPTPFGDAYPQLDRWVVGDWWKEPWKAHTSGPKGKRPEVPPFPIDVARDQVVAFVIYTVDVKPDGGPGVLKITAQLYPLKPGETREARLELKRGDGYGVARWEFAKPGTGHAMPGTLTFECWPRFPAKGPDGKLKQFPGWPVVTDLPTK